MVIPHPPPPPISPLPLVNQLQEVMADLDKKRSSVDTNSLPVDKYKDIEPTIDNVLVILILYYGNNVWLRIIESNRGFFFRDL